MDGNIIDFDADRNRGGIIGNDGRNYDFLTTDWHSAGQPQSGDAVEFVTVDRRATEIYRRQPAYIWPLTSGEFISAVYRTAFGRTGGRDLFGDAPVPWRRFIPPVLILTVLCVIQSFRDGSVPAALRNRTLPVAMLLLAVLAVVLLLVFMVSVGVVWILGRIMAPRDRVRVGVLSYLWLQAALLQPWITLTRPMLGPNDTFLAISMGITLLAIVAGSGRVLQVAFRLDGLGRGVFIVLAAAIVGYLIS
jgi:hypothetical protein